MNVLCNSRTTSRWRREGKASNSVSRHQADPTKEPADNKLDRHFTADAPNRMWMVPEFLWHGAEAYGFRGDVWTCVGSRILWYNAVAPQGGKLG
jgi:hypothetical protein